MRNPKCHLIPILILLLLTTSAFAQDDADKCCGYDVTGYLWNDLNGNGIDETEPRLAGWTIEAYNVSSSFLAATVITDANGDFTFTAPVGCGPDAQFSLVLQSGWGQTFPGPPGTHFFPNLTGCGATYDGVNFGVTGGPCDPHTETWTLDGEFTTGDLNGVAASSDNLELTPQPTTLGYAWVANHGGTVSRIDIATGNEVGRYFTGPSDIGGSHNYLSPSRTAVDKDGNCWVLNRAFGQTSSVTQILATAGIDRNSNGTIETSADNLVVDGIISPGEMLPWGDDERVARHYVIGGTFPDDIGRALAIDKEGFLWIGLFNGKRVLKLDPSLSTLTYAPDTSPAAPPELASISTDPYLPYGLALSPSGLLYMGTLSQYALEIDPGVASGGTVAGPAVTQYIQHSGVLGGASNYGICVDQDCVVWLTASHFPVGGGGNEYGCVRWDPSVGVGDPTQGWSWATPGATSHGRGITVDYSGDIWMSMGDGSVSRFAPTNPPTWLANYVTGLNIPVGVGVASDGNMVVIDSASPSWVKLDSSTGAVIGLPGPTTAGPYPYTYSDFTGSLASIVSEQQGFWTAISDAGDPSMLWTTVSWNETTPPGTEVEVSYRVAASLGMLSSVSWTPVAVPGLLGSPVPGQFMEVRVRLTRDIQCGDLWVTPLVHDVTVDAVCDPCVLGPSTPVIVECDSPSGTIVFFSIPSVPEGECDAPNPVICAPPAGSLFPIGTTTVTCYTVTTAGDTLWCDFPVVVNGDCDAITGGCCLDDDCLSMTEGECDERGGIYMGDGSDCEYGCDFTCARPPRNLAAWFPLDYDSGGNTPNIAEPTVPGALNGPPTPLPGEYVTSSYHFDAAAANQQIRAADHSSLDVNSGDLTIDAWVRTDQAEGLAPIVDKRQDSPVQGYAVFLHNGYLGVQLASGGSWVNWVLNALDGPEAFVADGQWHMVAVTIDRNNAQGLKFYVDGAQVGAARNPTSVTGSTGNSGDLLMGRSHAMFSSAVWYNGDLDEVELFRRALTADEIQNINSAGATGKCREGCSLPDHIVACGGNSVTTSVTICNYDDMPHLYSWGLSPLMTGCTSPASSFSPAFGSVTVAGGDCVSIPVTVQIPTGLPVGGTSCFQVTIFNHDTGRVFGCTGSIKKNHWWCIKWKDHNLVELPGIVQVNPHYDSELKFQIAHIGPVEPGLVMDYELRPVRYEDDEILSDNMGLNGLPAGRTASGSVEIPDDGTDVVVPVRVDLTEHLALGFDKIQLWADDDMDGIMESIGEVVIRSTLNDPSGVGDDTPDLMALRAFRTVPNPFNPQTTISFELSGSQPQEVDLRIFDLRGFKVKEIYTKQMLQPGVHTIDWAGDDKRGRRLASGVYLVQIVTPTVSETVKAVLVK